MFNCSRALIDKLIIHKVGNKSKEEGYLASNEVFSPDEMTENLLVDHFTKPLKSKAYFKFAHDTNLYMNEVYSFCRAIFEKPDSFIENSVNILKHLYNASNHANINSGEVYVVLFKDFFVHDLDIDGIGIFKSENKDSFITINDEDRECLSLDIIEGISLNKIDKGCIILNTMEDSGYNVLNIDNNVKDTQFWSDTFLGLVEYQDSRFHTEKHIDMCKQFAQETFPGQKNRHRQMDVMNRAYDYFKDNNHFEMDAFGQQVFDGDDSQYRDRFLDFRDNFIKENDSYDIDEFEIEKRSARMMKSMLKQHIKLDTNVEIKVNYAEGNQKEDVLESGFDENKKMYFYKIYYNEEL